MKNNNFIKFEKLYKNRCLRGKDMTICIVAISELATPTQKLIFASDRLATDQNGLTFELGIPKVRPITENCLVMSAGNAGRADSIINKVIGEISKRNIENENYLLIEEIVSIFESKYKEVKDKAIQKEIFDSKGMTREEFYKNIKNFPDWFSILIDSNVNNFDFNVGLIIFGFDINKESKTFAPHIYEVSGNGESVCWDSTGFAMIGIGYSQSVSEITKKPYNPFTKMQDTILKVYRSKKSAQRVTGVGEYTDLGYMEVVADLENNKAVSRSFFASDDIKKMMDNKLEEQGKKIEEIEEIIKKNIESSFIHPVEPPEVEIEQKVTL